MINELWQYLLTLGFLIVIALFISWIALKQGFYHYSVKLRSCPQTQLVPGLFVFFAFALFLFVELVLVPGAYSYWNQFFGDGAPNDLEKKDWSHIVAAVVLALLLLLFCRLLGPVIREKLWGSSKNYWFFNWLVGAGTWVIAYPFVLVVGQLMGILFFLFGYQGDHPQVAVAKFREVMGDPWLLVGTVFMVIFIVPFVEELLFRGFLQTWLKSVFGNFTVSRFRAIAVTSIIFSLFHFSPEQGLENIEYLLALFVFSCYLGFIRERQDSLWASIGLHSLFNLITLIAIILETTQAH